MRDRMISTMGALLLLLGGCYAPPRTEKEAVTAKLEGAVDPEEYWTRSDVPVFRDNVKRIAIAEFGVEFIDQKLVKAGPGAAVVDPTAITPPGLALEAFGVDRRTFEYPDSLLRELPVQMYDDLVAFLGGMGVQVVPPARVRRSRSYPYYKTQPAGESGFTQLANPIGTDTGRVGSYVSRGHPELPLIVGVTGDFHVEDVDAAIRKGLQVDLVARVRIRVGVHDGLASIERDSRIAVLGPDSAGTLVSNRALTSPEPVAWGGAFEPGRGTRYVVDAAKYKAAMHRLLPLYLKLGLPE